jgi:4-diphosphocytidyl-2-C-methyl-D-erythritol kinase
LSPASPTASVTEAAPAKLNLYLHVVGRRADGYHLLDSLVAFAEHGDELRAVPASDLSLALDGPFAAALTGEADNLVLRAARALRDKAKGPGAALTLTKNLPVASGIGGGSADAAAALRALRRLWAASSEGLADLALTLGADVPVCLQGASAYMGGVGEEIAPAPALPAVGLVLINPLLPLPTPQVFAARAHQNTGAGFSSPARFTNPPRTAEALATFLAGRRNDLEPAAITLMPQIATMLEALTASPGCRLARMSGSGATCFAIYDDKAVAEAAAAWIVSRHSGWWIKPTRLAVR